jgi:hypothetical protein
MPVKMPCYANIRFDGRDANADWKFAASATANEHQRLARRLFSQERKMA